MSQGRTAAPAGPIHWRAEVCPPGTNATFAHATPDGQNARDGHVRAGGQTLVRVATGYPWPGRPPLRHARR